MGIFRIGIFEWGIFRIGTDWITSTFTEGEKTNIAENIIKELELDKVILLKDEKKEITPNTLEKKRIKSKKISIHWC